MRYYSYVDGFNLYHSIARLGYANNHLKWLDIYKLSKSLIGANHQLMGVKFFSAYPYWKPASKIRHEIYVESIQAMGVDAIMSNFKNKQVWCDKCKQNFTKHEEKETDIKIALNMVQDAYNDLYDCALLITSDTDLIPAVQSIIKLGKNVKLIIPPGQAKYCNGLAKNCNQQQTIKIKHLKRNLLPEKINFNNKHITRPLEYTPPITR